MIIIEGPNGSGKTTLAHKVQKITGMPIIHATRPKNRLHSIIASIRQTFYSGVILDRAHPISRIVYQKKVVTKFERKIQDWCIKRMYNKGVIIYCTGEGPRDFNKPHYTPELIKETTENQAEIRQVYNDIMMKIPHIKYDFKVKNCLQIDSYLI